MSLRSATAFALLLAIASQVFAQAKTKPTDSRKVMESLDKALGVSLDGRQLAERDYRICMVDKADRLLGNKVDSARLLAIAANGTCSTHLSMIYLFEEEAQTPAAAKAATENVRDAMLDEMTSYIVCRRAGTTC
ncbi:hypothetical protein [Hydrogenophaga sp.]|uniref:hypothetical protein n=1 Tax=Hydrogenophaga sp. TaxID=1904254 RepID=UPI00286E1D63|nr:hypothetical protein [Hydrogenophaga sp.]